MNVHDNLEFKRTRYAEIEKAAIDVANDLEAELNARYPASVREFPCMQQDFDGDMQSVIALRAALALPEDSSEARDAERYRWLRSTQNTECAQGSLEDLAWFALHNESPEKLDAAIDAALALPAQANGEDSKTASRCRTRSYGMETR